MNAVAIFKAEHSEFGKRTVPHFEAAAADARQRYVFLAGSLIDPDRVTLAEGTAPTILTGEPNALALGKKAAEGKSLGR